ncbi:MAG: NAD(P)H-dependent oxidoreductase [Gammaproteobacteria bacterium]|nr:NAD(P)H-dependent oxidoreductase [Gammaproteobacteria bacterium]
MKLLHIEASPRKEASASSRVADAFVTAYRRLHPDHVVERLALFEEQLPAFGAEGADQKTEHVLDLVRGGTGIEATGEWAGVMREVERLASADKVLLSSPMWNFSIPYPLKHYIDLICQPGLTFRVDAQGYLGLVTGKPLQLVLASGGSYPEGFPLETHGTATDFQRPYLEHVARFIGFEDIRAIRIERTSALLPEALEELLARRCEEAAEAAATF